MHKEEILNYIQSELQQWLTIRDEEAHIIVTFRGQYTTKSETIL